MARNRPDDSSSFGEPGLLEHENVLHGHLVAFHARRTSVMWVIRRVPSLKRATCTNRSTAELTCCRMERTPMLAFAIPTITSRRPIASRGLLAWTVVSEPSWPVFMAWSMSSASSAAALTDDDAVGPHAQRVDHQVADVDGAVPFDVGRPGFHARHVRLAQPQFGGVFDGDDPLVLRDVGGEHVEQGRLAGAGAAR